MRSVADLVILIDVSGSMQECLDAVKASIGNFVATATTKDANNDTPIEDLRIRVCGFRDKSHDGDSWFIDNPFVRDVGAVQGQLLAPSMQASGGGDESESLLDALLLIADAPATGPQDAEAPSHWRDRSAAHRIVLFFTDATFKSPMTNGGTVTDVIAKIQQSRIKLFGLAPDWSGYHELFSADESQYTAFVTVAEAPALAGLGKPGEEGRLAMKASVAALRAKAATDSGQFGKIMDQFAKSISGAGSVVILPS